MANKKTKIIHIKDIFKKLSASQKTSFSTHMSIKIYHAKIYHIIPRNIDIQNTISIVWAATLSTIFIFFAQKYCDMRVVHAIENQLQTDIIKKVIGKLIETAATASFQSLPTQNASVN